MKKFIFSMLMLGGLNSFAINADFTKADLQDANEMQAGYCNNYNDTALREIFKKLMTIDSEKLELQLANNEEQRASMNYLISAILQARSLRTESIYVDFHTRRGSAAACLASYQQTQKLKALLNL